MKSRFLLILLLLAGCGRDSGPQFAMPEFREEVRARAEIITAVDGPSYIIDYVFPTDSYLIVFKYTTLPEVPFLYVYDKRSGEPVMQNIFKGRGPADLVHVQGADFNTNTGDMLVTDGTGGFKNITYFNIYDLLADGIPRFEKKGVTNWTEYACLLDEERMLLKNDVSKFGKFNPRPRFEIYDAWDSLLATYTEFPIRDTVTNINFWLHQQARLSLSPDRKRLAVGTLLRGATLECFDIAEDDIALRWEKFLIDPAYDRQTGERNNKALSGFMDVYAADELIVTVLGDDKQDEVRSICLFDWDGQAVKRIVLEDEELDVFRVCMDSEGNIYALVKNNKDSGYLARIVETGPAPDGYRISESKIKRFSPEEDPEPSIFGVGM